MSSKAARKRNKRKFKMPKDVQPKEAVTLRTAPTTRPTWERLQHGCWAEPSGMGKNMQPIVDLASDMIGELYQGRQITTAQEQAARTFQEVRAEWADMMEVTAIQKPKPHIKRLKGASAWSKPPSLKSSAQNWQAQSPTAS